MKAKCSIGIAALVALLAVASAALAQSVRPVVQSVDEQTPSLPPGATNLTVTFDQDRLVKWPNSSLITIPFKVTYTDASGTTQELGASDLVATYHLDVLDTGGTYTYSIFGAAKDADKLYLEDGFAESRYMVQRLQYCKECPPDAVRVLLLFDLSSSVDASIPEMAANAPALVDALFANQTFVSKHNLQVGVAWFSGNVADLNRIANLTGSDFFADKDTVNKVIADNIKQRPRGTSTGLVDAVDVALNALTRVEDNTVTECCPEARRTVKVLITVTEFVHRTGDPSAAKLTRINNPGPNYLLFGIKVRGESPNAWTATLAAALSSASGSVPYQDWPAAIAGIPPRIAQEAREERNGCEYEYLLYTCVAPRDQSPFVPTATRTVKVGLTYGISTTTPGSFTYTTADLKDGCFLWDFDVDADGFYRNLTLGEQPGFDAYTRTNYLDARYKFKAAGQNHLCLTDNKISPQDEDHSGCLPNVRAAECVVPVNCTTEKCKFGFECDQDGDETDGKILLQVDRCHEIHQVVPYLQSSPPAFPTFPDGTSSFVINREPEVPNGIPNVCPGPTPASSSYYCDNRIDENANGRDAECPPPPAFPGCSDTGLPAQSTLEQALARTNTLIIPDVRRGVVGTSSWQTDLRLIANGPAPGTPSYLNPCQYKLNCLLGPDGFFHAVACPQGVDVDGNQTVDTCGFCYVEDPWVELFFVPALDAVGGSAPPTVLSRRLCLPSNGALPLDDVLSVFTPAPTNASGILVVSSNYDLLVQNKKTITSPDCTLHADCPHKVVKVETTATVDAAARTFVNTSGMGKRVSAIPIDKALGPTDVTRLCHLTAPDRAFNADIGIVNFTPGDVAFYVRLYHADGALMDTMEWNVRAKSVAWIQNVLTGKAGYDVCAAIQVIRPQGNEKWMAWASSTETTTGDQFFVEPGPTVAGTTGGTLYLPLAERNVLAPDTRYVITDVELMNLDDPLTVSTPASVTYWLASTPNTKRTVSLLEAGKAYRLIDLIADGLGFATGVTNDTLVIEVPAQASGRIGASAYRYELQVTTGTPLSSSFGAGISAVDRLVAPGTTVKIPLFGAPRYSSSVVVTNPSNTSITVTVQFLGALGFSYSTTTFTLAPNATKVVANPDPTRRTGTAKVTNASTNTGDAVVYLKVTDNTSTDPFVLVGR